MYYRIIVDENCLQIKLNIKTIRDLDVGEEKKKVVMVEYFGWRWGGLKSKISFYLFSKEKVKHKYVSRQNCCVMSPSHIKSYGTKVVLFLCLYLISFLGEKEYGWRITFLDIKFDNKKRKRGKTQLLKLKSIKSNVQTLKKGLTILENC